MSKIALEGNASGTGTLTIASQNTNSNYTLTLPNSTGTLVVTGGAQTIEFAAGTASAPSITTTGDTNTGIFFPAADTIAFTEGGAEAMRIDSSGNVGIGTTSPTALSGFTSITLNASGSGNALFELAKSGTIYGRFTGSTGGTTIAAGGVLAFSTGASIGAEAERARITSGGQLLVGTTSYDDQIAGTGFGADGFAYHVVSGGTCLNINRKTNDGILVNFQQDNTSEGNISVSGSTVSYNGGHLSRYAQTQAPKDDTLLKGTVLSNLDEMNVYTDAEGNPVPNEQLNKVKVSDAEGDVNVAGVFVNWSYDEAHQVDEINMAMTGDMIIRIAQGVVVQKGDLLMSAGDGTAKPQGDDIVRSKTVAKVTSNHVTCTYEDGSYCVPCVLMAC